MISQQASQGNEFGCILEGAVSTVVLSEVIQKAVQTFPQDTARIERAYGIMLFEGIQHLTGNMFAVQSSDTTPVYIVEGDYCPCPDRQNRSVVCKHLYAAYLYQWTTRRMDYYADLDHNDYVNGNWEARTIEDERYVWAS